MLTRGCLQAEARRLYRGFLRQVHALFLHLGYLVLHPGLVFLVLGLLLAQDLLHALQFLVQLDILSILQTRYL